MPRGELKDLTQTIQEAGLAARTLLTFAWNGSGPNPALQEAVLKEAIEIEGMVREFMEEELSSPKSSLPSKESSNEKARHNEKGGQSSSQKFSKWLGKLSKK